MFVSENSEEYNVARARNMDHIEYATFLAHD